VSLVNDHKRKDFKLLLSSDNCWVCVIFFACVCVGTSDLTNASDDPSLVVFFVLSVLGASYGGPLGG
jgi:hypothetical protein